MFNVAVGDRTSLNDLFKAIKTSLSETQPQVENAKPAYRDFRAGGVRHSQADISKGKTLLGYQPTHRILDGISEAMLWYTSNQNT